MAQAARNANQEYWRPADPATDRIARPILAVAICRDCGASYSMGARFCHMCGVERNRRPLPSPGAMSFADFFGVAALRQRFGLSVLCLVFFLVGLASVVVAFALGVGMTETSAEWHAVQLWRIEWLVGAAAAMLAGVLLKKR